MNFKMIKDPFKSEGAVLLKIQKLNQPRDESNCRLHSDAIYVRGLQWRIRVDIMEPDSDDEQKYLGHYIECNAGDTGKLA
jgi:hypothetical protein